MQSVSSARNSSGSKSYVQAYCAVLLLVLIKHFDFLYSFFKIYCFLYKESSQYLRSLLLIYFCGVGHSDCERSLFIKIIKFAVYRWALYLYPYLHNLKR